MSWFRLERSIKSDYLRTQQLNTDDKKRLSTSPREEQKKTPLEITCPTCMSSLASLVFRSICSSHFWDLPHGLNWVQISCSWLPLMSLACCSIGSHRNGWTAKIRSKDMEKFSILDICNSEFWRQHDAIGKMTQYLPNNFSRGFILDSCAVWTGKNFHLMWIVQVLWQAQTSQQLHLYSLLITIFSMISIENLGLFSMRESCFSNLNKNSCRAQSSLLDATQQTLFTPQTTASSYGFSRRCTLCKVTQQFTNLSLTWATPT